jgi:peroxiredoxin
MAQLRQDYQQFVDREAEVIAVGPDSAEAFTRFWDQYKIPFVGLADPLHTAARLYDQEVNLFKFGRVPAEMVIDKQGIVRFVHYASSMADIPDNETIFQVLDQINTSE